MQEATCPYVVSKRKAIESRIAFTNIAYYATGVRFDEAWDKRNITVFDEAHSLESALYNQIEIIIDRRILNLFKIAGIDFTINTIKSMKSEKNWSANNYWKSSQGRPVEFLDALDKLTKLSPVIVKKLNSWSEDKVFKKKRKALDKFYTTLQYILNKPDDNLWIIDVYEYTDTDLESYEHGFIKLSARPVFIRDFTQRLIFSQAKQFVFQSATIIDGKQFAYELGINNWKGMRYKTPFSKDNRRIYALDCGSLARESFKESLPKCINTLEDILDARLYQKGIVHTASYELQMTLKQKLKPSARYLFPRNSKENEEALRVHELSANTVLFSPSMTQGVDLRDGLARFCVIFKVPYPNLGDRRVFRKSKIDRGWYNYATAKTVIQATGRGVRSSEDWCDTFIIDSSFNKLYKNYSALDWYLGDAIELNPELARDAIYERRD